MTVTIRQFPIPRPWSAAAALMSAVRAATTARGGLVAVAVGLLGLVAGGSCLAGLPARKPAVAAAPPPPVAPDALPAGAIRRLGWSPLRIGSSAFALCPGGKEIVAVAPEGIVRRFDARTGRLLERRL